MKKFLVLCLVALMGLAMLGVVGCGSTDKAKQYLKDAEKSWDKAKQSYAQEIDAVLKLYLASTKAEAQSAVDELTKAVKADKVEEDKAVKDLLNAAKAEYQKITSLKGVDAYVACAEANATAIDKYIALVDADLALDAKLKPAVESGDPDQVAQAIKDASADIKNIESLQRQAAAAWSAAQKLRNNI